MNVEFWFAGAGLIVTIFFSTQRILSEMRKNQDSRKEAIDEQLKNLKKEFIAADEEVRKAVAEVGNSTRGKIQQLELWVRDNNVSKEDYKDDMASLIKLIEALGSRLETRFASFDSKLDTLQQFNIEQLRERT